jgi:methionine-rich copper-binding protein CopC
MHRIFAVGALCVAAVLLTAVPASAHSQLVSSTPAADEVLSTLPAQFSVTMNEDLLDLAGDGTGFGLEVTGPDGRYYGDGCLTITGPTLAIGASIGGSGLYTVVYQVVSEDGHPVSNQFTFMWDGVATGPGSAKAPRCGETVTTFAPTPTATPTPQATAEPVVSNGVPVWGIVVGIVGVLALVAIIVLAVLRQRRV